ncbi:DUF2497 domain-containing protein [Rhizobium wenxiniae]|uniref:PopZ family protein n=1 Tax=Rhizobium wenxiniae TaxID=1737357 RepID=UPI001C6F1A0D|nr:DUF2497 domain-containing protein [Rhizobium wenxiniae]
MAQPNVAREPSMEEILASIRRIIESNDPGSEAALQEDVSAFDDDEIESFDGPAAFAPDLAANDAGLPRQSEFSPRPELVAAPAAAEKSLSLADVAARVRAASVRHQDMAASRAGAASDAGSSLARDTMPLGAETVTQASFKEPSAPVIALQLPELRPSFGSADTVQPSAPMLAETARVVDEEILQPARSASIEDVTALETNRSEPAETSAHPTPVEAKPEPAQPVTSVAAMAGLLSEAAGAQVARSFGELAEVFDGLERRSVEEMAQDMLRPMLQEWLDDNLPTLVERLVREEIERVARGPRR